MSAPCRNFRLIQQVPEDPTSAVHDDPAPLKNLWHRHLVTRLLGDVGAGGAACAAAGHRTVVQQRSGALVVHRFDADGEARDGQPILVADGIAPGCSAALGVDRRGQFVVAWNERTDRIRARRFDENGIALGEAFTVNSSDEGAARRNPVVAVNAAGACVILWEHGATHLRARLFGPQGQPFGPEVDLCLELRAAALA
jgi:hypothetical protein